MNRLADIVGADEVFLENAAEALYQQLALPDSAMPALDRKVCWLSRWPCSGA